MAMTVALGTTVSAAPVAKNVPATGAGTGATVSIDGAHPGPEFQGIGAISGGGGNSRLLIDYPPGERAQILDYLFLPHFGAALQMLKLEIGGGGFSSDGSEPSVEPAKSQLDCGAGYEFWLARQALARNPAIRLYGLQWSAPAWVRDPHGGLWSRADVGYVVDWLRCARRKGLAVSYVAAGTSTTWHRRPAGLVREPAHGAGHRWVHPHPDRRGRRGSADGRTARAGAIFSAARLADRADAMVTDPSFGRVVSVLACTIAAACPRPGTAAW